jgi:2-amino-4-hydroxy-6-hydroxymethyldihydropteridine diphosphokinase
MRVRAYVGLGANVGDAPATLAAAVHALAALPGVQLHGVSRLYRTRPVGVTDQPDFHNAVVALEVPAGPDPETGAMALLIALKGIERAFGRQKRERWGPRELDLDLLVFGPHQIRVERAEAAKSADPRKPDGQWLEVPHPQARERLFVLAPMAELAPRLTPPGWGESVASARKKREAVEGAESVARVARWEREWRPLQRA